jgi:starch-binding outer membrane protein, SusD/RagB family
MKKIIYLLVVALTVMSCETEDFLSKPQPTDEISGTLVTPDLALTGMYSAYRDFYGGNHDVATTKAFYLGADLQGRDVQTPDFNWYIFEHRWDVTTIPNARRNNYVWDLCYSLIFHANTLMYVLDTNPSGLSAEDAAAYRGQALTLRALAYYDLVRTFQFTYAKNPQALGVPLDLSIADSDPKPRATLAEIYDQMYADLNDALPLLTESRKYKYWVNSNVAKGIYARIALEKQDYVTAARMAMEAKEGYPLMNQSTYTAGFNDYENAEWIWGFPFVAAENWGFASFYSFIDHDRTAGYKNLYINSTLYNTFSATDYRRSLIVATGSTVVGKQYRTRKFRDLSDLSGHMVLMRASEMYLIEAEAKAFSDLPGAKAILLQLQRQRDPNATLSSATTVEAFVEEVLLERRKELYAELGTDFFDMKRYQKGMLRTGNAVWNVVGYSLGTEVPATSNNWNFLIPQTEMDFNPLMVQNPVE